MYTNLMHKCLVLVVSFHQEEGNEIGPHPPGPLPTRFDSVPAHTLLIPLYNEHHCDHTASNHWQTLLPNSEFGLPTFKCVETGQIQVKYLHIALWIPPTPLVNVMSPSSIPLDLHICGVKIMLTTQLSYLILSLYPQ